MITFVFAVCSVVVAVVAFRLLRRVGRTVSRPARAADSAVVTCAVPRRPGGTTATRGARSSSAGQSALVPPHSRALLSDGIG